MSFDSGLSRSVKSNAEQHGCILRSIGLAVQAKPVLSTIMHLGCFNVQEQYNKTRLRCKQIC